MQDYEVLGTRFRIQTQNVELADSMNRLLAPFGLGRRVGVPCRNCYGLVDGDSMEGRHGTLLAYRDCKPIGSGAEWQLPVAATMTSLNRRAIEACELFAAHAGVIGVGGRAIAFPAGSGLGKSTLTAACLRAGFDYVSDEAVCVDPGTGTVVPYPKPMGLSQWSRTALGVDDTSLAFPAGSSEGLVTAGDLGAELAIGPLRLEHVIIAEYGHDSPQLLETAGSEAMAVLLEMSFNHYKFGAQAFHLAARLANEARPWRLTYDDPIEAGRLLWERFGS